MLDQTGQTIAIGDIHGCADVLRVLIEALAHKAAPRISRFVFLGDLVDRGPRSRLTMDVVCDVFDYFPDSVLLLGNHDEFFRSFLRGTLSLGDADKWMANGGWMTLQDYGLLGFSSEEEVEEAVSRVDRRHKILLEGAVSMLTTERYCFVHAGIDPAVPLGHQNPRTLNWIREGFIDHHGPLEKVVVHGHTITSSSLPEIHYNRIALDTGSYITGRISAAIFENDMVVGFASAEIENGTGTVRYYDEQMVPRQ